MDWEDGAKNKDFLGFSISRRPGFRYGESEGYLLNRIGFGPPGSGPYPSDIAPIQKFLWWDSAILAKFHGTSVEYTITPILGTGQPEPGETTLKLIPQTDAATTLTVDIPGFQGNGIATWFNRAVVSSQAFQREFPDPADQLDQAMSWLANGMSDAFEEILRGTSHLQVTAYHLTDNQWVMPALEAFQGDISIVYQDQPRDQTDRPAIKVLASANARLQEHRRSKTRIMHDKFIVDIDNGRVLMGSANFTPEGITTQANLLHIFNSPELAKLYEDRHRLLAESPEPTIAQTAVGAGWSAPIQIGAATVRAFFSPEPKGQRQSLDTIVRAVEEAKSSVAFCLFSPTDQPLLNALKAVTDRGKLLYGMLNSLQSGPKTRKMRGHQAASGEIPLKMPEDAQIHVQLFTRSRRDTVGFAYSYFRPGSAPAGFLPELSTLDTSSKSLHATDPRVPAVHIHHKFIVIDADTNHPIIYTGSANFSENSTHGNDENVLEIRDDVALAENYLAEFMRIYQHYRARALWDKYHRRSATNKRATTSSPAAGFTLSRDRDGWAKYAYRKGTDQYLERTTLAHQ